MDKYLFLDNTIFMLMIIVGIPATIHFLKVFSKKPYKYKSFFSITLILLLILNVALSDCINHNDYKKLIDAKINSEITNIRRSKNAKRYWLKNDMVMILDSPYKVDLQLKDIIVKDSNSNLLRVFRHNNSREYVLICTFNY